jgi:ribosomal protein S12 methylthiotransferase
VFTYSREDGTAAWELGDPVPQQEKERRKTVLMELQQEISERKNEELVGTTQRVIIDRQEQEVSSGRTQWDAPEIDNEVLVHDGGALNVGEFYDVEIVGSYEYDLEGRVRLRRQGRNSS